MSDNLYLTVLKQNLSRGNYTCAGSFSKHTGIKKIRGNRSSKIIYASSTVGIIPEIISINRY
jgi:hypothetical protein